MAVGDFPNLLRRSFEVDRTAGVIFSPILEGFLWLSHGVTTRAFAPAEADVFDLVGEVRRRLVPGGARIFCAEQVHGDRIVPVEPERAYSRSDEAKVRGPVVELLGADGLIVSDAALPVTVRTADCVPLFIVDVRQRRVALVHSGWRGSLARIAEKAVAEMGRLGSDPEDLVAWMGPAIGRDAYRVSPELARRFETAFPDYEGVVCGDCLDLVLLNAYQLRSAGVPSPQIHAANCSTAENLDVCWSYRAEGDRAGRMVAYAMILK